ncbi:unnamed protein product [Hyaloperonospora brassicae]|uniref:Uncharacterized protein n=1 Tax=Hyaloperonospora brassicae TaxID=162125 RepID=A0AAV0UXS1_HYABA|nr:unnamed protein product [Hyaloperonospora brassicae]
MKTATVSTAIALLLATAARSDDSSVVTQPSGAGGGPEPTTVDFDGTDMHDEDKGDTTANDNLLGTSWIGGRPLYIETNQGTVAVGPDDKSMHSISTKSKDTMADFDGTGAGPSGPMTKVDQDDMMRPDMTGVNGSMVNPMLTDTDQDDMMVMTNVTGVNGTMTPVLTEVDQDDMMRPDMTGVNGSMANPMLTDTDQDDMMVMRNVTGVNGTTTPVLTEVDQDDLMRPDMTGVNGSMVNPMLTDTDQDDMMVMSNVTNINDSIAATNAAVVTPDGSCVPVSVEGDATYCVQGPVCSGSGSVPAGWSCPRMGDMATADCHDTLASYGTAGCILPETSICRPLNTGVWGCVLSSVADNISTTPAIVSSAMYRPDTVNMTGVSGSMVNPMLTDTDQDDMMVMSNVTNINDSIAATNAAVVTPDGSCVPVSVEGDATYCVQGPVCSGSGSVPAGWSCPRMGDMATADCHDTLASYGTAGCILPETSICRPLNTGVWGCVLSSVADNISTTPAIVSSAMYRPDTVNMTGVSGIMVNSMLTDTDQDDMMVMSNVTNINDSIAATNAAVVTPDGSCVPVSVEGDATYCVQGPVCSGSGSVPAGWSCPRMGDMATADCHDTLASYGTAGCILPETSICRPLNTGVWGCVLSSVADNISTTPAIVSSAMYRPDTVNMTGVSGIMVNSMLTDTDQDDMMVMSNVTNINDSIAATNAAVVTPDGSCVPVSVEGDATYCVQGPVCSGSGSVPAGWSCPRMGDMATADCHDTLASYGTAGCILPETSICRPLNTGVWGCVLSSVADNSSTTPAIGSSAMYRPDTVNMTGVNGSMVNPMLTDTDQDDMMVMTNVTGVNGTTTPVLTEVDQDDLMRPDMTGVNGSMVNPMLTDTDQDDMMVMTNVTGVNGTTTPVLTEVDQDDMMRPDMTGVNGSMVNPMLTDTDQDDMMVMTNMTNINDSIAATNAAVVTPDGSCVPVSVEGDATYCVQGPVCSGSGSVPAGWSCPRMGDMATADCNDTLASYGTAGCILPETSICRPLNTGVWGCVLSSVADNSSTTPAIRASVMAAMDPNSASDDSSSFSVFAAVGIGAACVVAVAAFVLFKKRQRKSAEASQLAHQTFVDVKTP